MDEILTVFECCKKANPEQDVERVVGTELEPSLRYEGKLYKLVDTIFYGKDSELPLWAGFADRGFKLYTQAPGTYSESFLLLYKSEHIKQFKCPPTIDGLIRAIYAYDKTFVCFIILGLSVKAMIKTRATAWDAARVVWEAARYAARDAAEDAYAAEDAATAQAVAWDAVNAAYAAEVVYAAAWDAVNAANAAAWDAAAQAVNAAWDAARYAARYAVWDAANAQAADATNAAKKAFKQTIKSIKVMLK